MQDLARSISPTKTISEMAREYGVSLRTLRFYEDRDLLSPQRIDLHRLYSPKDEIRLQIILKGKRLGFSLCEIKKMIADTHRESRSEEDLMVPRQAIGNQIESLERKRMAVTAAIDELKLALTG